MKKVVIIVSVVVCLLIGVFVLTYPKIVLNGKDKIIVNVKDEYKEENATLKKFLSKDKVLETKDVVDTSKVGKYKVTYKTKFLFFDIKKERTIEVVDKNNPVITLGGKEEVYVCPNEEYKEDGYKAIDDYDGDITDKIKIEKSDNLIKYSVYDSSNNLFEITRKIIKEDKEKPIITLKGSSTIILNKNNKFVEPGFDVIDNCDKDIKVDINGSVNTSKVGEYKITYKAKDSSNNETTVNRTVLVKEKVTAKNPTSKSAVVYLTFDDGPSLLTPKILDILKKENVKATFFVTGKNPSLDYVIKRAYNEGHTIALHTYSHDYYSIYKSSDAYFKDLYKVRDRVERVTGKKANIIRFPGGSSNTVSSFNKGIMTKLSREVKEKGFKYYDWNISSGDAGGTTKSSGVYNNVIKGVSPKRINMVLMHDSIDKTYTLNALSNIIKSLKKSGYSFSGIDENTPQVTHGINN